MRINVPLAPLNCKPCAGAERDDEAWYGEAATILEERGGFARVRLAYGYESYARLCDLSERDYKKGAAFYRVQSAWADIVKLPSYRAPLLLSLPRGSLVAACEDRPQDGFLRIRLVSGEAGFTRASWLGPAPAQKTQGFSAGAADLRRKIIAAALQYRGTPYRWGGRSPAGIDCSGLCHAAYWRNGVAIYRNARLLEGWPIKKIDRVNLQAADLLYFPGHIALYLGDGRYLHATGRAGDDGVCINSLLPGDARYRADLAESLLACGSLFR
jgi:beta-lactamase class A